MTLADIEQIGVFVPGIGVGPGISLGVGGPFGPSVTQTFEMGSADLFFEIYNARKGHEAQGKAASTNADS